jgi:cytochrome c peroxidase
MNKRLIPILLALLAAVAVMATLLWPKHQASPSVNPVLDRTLADPARGREALPPLPPVPALSPEKVALGERLFFDKRLSKDNSIACASCHDFARGGSDRMPVSIGVDGQRGPINAPTVFNAALNFVQFWDGRAASLEAQAAGPVHNPLEMASNWVEVLSKLRSDRGYHDAFQRLYPQQGMSGEAIVDAIATYERTLITTNSRFDRFLQGESTALNALEKSGYQRFLDYGCASCHQGTLLGGNMYQRFGVMGDYFAGRTPSKTDLGRFNVTGRAEDRHVFKVPSLRNVAVTAPYFHDGSGNSLEEAVVIMGRYQLGRDLSGPDVASISAFLRTLTGEWQGRLLE